MLKVTGLGHVYDNGTRALSGVTLHVPAGLFGLLGPNGAGKSTLMRIAATLQAPSEGLSRFEGIDVAAEPGRIRRTLGYLPQDFGVYPRVTVIDMLDHLATLKGFRQRAERRDLVANLLEEVRLWNVRHKALTTLSGGMRLRFGIAQALIGRPRLVIVDEPTAGLDPEERNRCLDLLAGIGDDAVVILSTHIVADVSDLCPRMAVLAGGRIVAEGGTKDFVASLKGRIWSRTLGHTELDSCRERFNVISIRRLAGQRLVRVLAEARPDPRFEPVVAELEDAYFAALGRAEVGTLGESGAATSRNMRR